MSIIDPQYSFRDDLHELSFATRVFVILVAICNFTSLVTCTVIFMDFRAQGEACFFVWTANVATFIVSSIQLCRVCSIDSALRTGPYHYLVLLVGSVVVFSLTVFNQCDNTLVHALSYVFLASVCTGSFVCAVVSMYRSEYPPGRPVVV